MKYQEDVRLIWEFLCPVASPSQADVIFVFGGLDLLVPRRAAELFNQGYAERILVSGGFGSLTKGVFKESEARVFADEMVKNGVPSDRIILEEEAGNTGANVDLGMKVLGSSSVSVGRVIAVAKPFIMRRVLATFELKCPDIEVVPCPPLGEMGNFIDRPEREFVERLIGEMRRLRDYAEAGFIAHVQVPREVSQVCVDLSEMLRCSA